MVFAMAKRDDVILTDEERSLAEKVVKTILTNETSLLSDELATKLKANSANIGFQARWVRKLRELESNVTGRKEVSLCMEDRNLLANLIEAFVFSSAPKKGLFVRKLDALYQKIIKRDINIMGIWLLCQRTSRRHPGICPCCRKKV